MMDCIWDAALGFIDPASSIFTCGSIQLPEHSEHTVIKEFL